MISTPVSGLFPDSDSLIPRFREAGDVTLDLFHRDGRVEDCWLGLDPHEFELFWRLAAHPGKRLTHRQLLLDGWSIALEPQTNSVAIRIVRLQAKLARVGLHRMIASHPEGGYVLHAPPGPGSFRLARPIEA